MSPYYPYSVRTRNSPESCDLPVKKNSARIPWASCKYVYTAPNIECSYLRRALRGTLYDMHRPGISPFRYLQVQQESAALVGCVFGPLYLCVFRDVVVQTKAGGARPHILSIRQSKRTAFVVSNTWSSCTAFVISNTWSSCLLIASRQCPRLNRTGAAHRTHIHDVGTVFCKYILVRSSSEMGQARGNSCR